MINLRAEQKSRSMSNIWLYKRWYQKGRISYSGENFLYKSIKRTFGSKQKYGGTGVWTALLSEGYIEAQPYRGYFVCQIDGLFQIDAQENNKRENNEQEQKVPVWFYSERSGSEKLSV